jgi:ketosteroid isomerase-like protein
MSSANLDLVRSIYADWERGEFGSVEWADPEIEYVTLGGPEPARGVGVGRLAKDWGDFLRAWGDYRVEAEEYRALDRQRVLVLTRNSARGRMSGLELGQMRAKGAGLFQLRDGKVTRLVVYWDRDRAFADLGLEG